MERSFRPIGSIDTNFNITHSQILRLPSDTLYGFAFNQKLFWEGKLLTNSIYNGKELIRINSFDSTGEMASIDKWAAYIKKDKNNHPFFPPFTDLQSFPFTGNTESKNSTFNYYLVESFIEEGQKYYRIGSMEFPKVNRSNDIKIQSIQRNYLIREFDFLPIEYEEGMQLLLDGDSGYQFMKYALSDYSFNIAFEDSDFTVEAIKGNPKLREYSPKKPTPLIPQDSLAPFWEITTLNGKRMNLNDLKGKLVLVDFFYKNCFPCIKALPQLQSLYTKYQSGGLEVIGMDPFDNEGEELPNFLKLKGITYPVALNVNSIVIEYKVSAYPTIYLIGKDGRIIFSQIGFGPGDQEDLEKIIISNL